MKRFFVALSLVSSMFVLFLCCSDGTTVSTFGGSGTETVGGILVDSLGNPVNNAFVRVAPVDTASSIEFWDVTNIDGEYLIEKIKAGIYNLEGFTQDSSLVIVIDSILYANDSIKLDLGIDTMWAPGNISGRVLVDSAATAGVSIYIPGTSYDAHSDDSGYFIISFILAGTHNVYYEYPGYLRGVDTNISVFSGLTTQLDTKNLSLDPNDKPPAPGFLSAAYDTVSGAVILTWEKVNVSDLLGYNVYRRDTTDTGFIKIATAYDTVYSDTIFKDLSDTNSCFYQYQVKSVDTLTNESDFSPRADINAISPTVLMTFFTWTLMPSDTDTVVNGQSVNLAVNFKNKVRKNILIRWYTKDPLEIVRTANVDTKEGDDTLTYTWQDTGVHLVCVEALDEKGDTWRDSCKVTVQGLIPTDTWEDFYPLVHKRRFSGAAVINDTLYAIGGAEDIFIVDDWYPNALASMELFNATDSSWSSFGTMPTARSAASVVAVGTKLFVIGGTNYDENFKTIETYNTQSNTWDTEFQMPSALFGHAACVINDSIYVFGGLTGLYETSSEINVFDPATGTWATKGSMSMARAYHQVVVLNDTVYIMGGINNLQDPTALTSVERYDPVSNTTSPIRAMNTGRMNFGAAVVNGKIYALGGAVSMFPDEFTALSSMEMYNPATDTWTGKKPLPSARHSFAICVNHNIMYILGGAEQGPPNFGQLGSVLRYYP